MKKNDCLHISRRKTTPTKNYLELHISYEKYKLVLLVAHFCYKIYLFRKKLLVAHLLRKIQLVLKYGLLI